MYFLDLAPYLYTMAQVVWQIYQNNRNNHLNNVRMFPSTAFRYLAETSLLLTILFQKKCMFCYKLILNIVLPFLQVTHGYIFKYVGTRLVKVLPV